MDTHANFGYSTVSVAPIPATSGTALTVTSSATFPAVPFNATIWPTGTQPTAVNAEIVRVTLIAANVLTITRAQESSSARTVIVGDQIADTITVKTLTDVENNIDSTAPVTQAFGDVAASGSSTIFARRDHKHGMPTIAPTVPTVVAVTAEFTSTGVPTATLPTGHTTNDILVLVLQSSNDSVVTAPAGYSNLGPQNGINAGAAALASRLSIYWKRDGGSEVAPTIPDTGDHTYGFMFAIRGCPTAGDPFHFLGNNFKFTTSTTGTSPVGTTTIDGCLVIDIFAGNVDNASAEGSSGANTDLTSFTEQFDDGTTDGTGGFLWMSSGIKATAGPIVATTVTWANTSSDLCSRIAFIPSNTTQINSSPRPVEIQTFIGSPQDLDSLWVKPTGARKVLSQICDGGGSGSGGRSAATAAGGGGGGGGGYAEAWYNAEDLAATVTVHAGKGGASVAADTIGNVGVLSEFDKGNRGPLTSSLRIAGQAAAAAISADGGNGGAGSGSGLSSIGTSTVRLDFGTLTATNSSSMGGFGGLGGSGTTAPVGGSPAERGGGGGTSGADTDAGIAANLAGYSLYGGGGGSGGRTNTNICIPGSGGGAVAPTTPQGAAGNDSAKLPYGGSGGIAGGSSVVTGGAGGFPGGGGGGGAGVAGGTGGRGGHGCVVVTTYF